MHFAGNALFASEKVEELGCLKETVEQEQAKLREEKRALGVGNVVDLKGALALLKAFRKGFDKRPVGEQQEILADIVRKLVVHPEKIVAEFYGGPAEKSGPKDGLEEFEKGIKKPPTDKRSVVRPISHLVDPSTRI